MKINMIFSAILLQTFQAVFADSFSKKPYFVNPKIGLNIFRKGDVFPACCLFTDFTVKMQMPVFVSSFVAAVVT